MRRRLPDLRLLDDFQVELVDACVNYGDIPVLPNAALVTHEPMQWVLDVQGPLGEVISRLSHLPIADVQLAPFTLDDAILRLLSADR